MTDTEFILTARKGAVLTVTLNRPEKSNSLHPDLVERLSNALDKAAIDRNTNVVILTGAGRSFCAGLDLELLAGWSAREKVSYLDTVIPLFYQLWTLPQPVIAAVNGPAIAGGFDLAAFCDIRLASTDAIFRQAEIDLGLTQIIHPLYKTIGLARAKELALTGRSISAEEAYRIGLVNHIYPPRELMMRAEEMADLLASKPRAALFETKRLTRELIDMDMGRAMKKMHESVHRRMESEEHSNRVAEMFARLSKRE
ncbi:MAG: enoyl-CoA hydratase/isomerase family protein [Blastocatellia bacterium]|nr:enoyl-CoA hydratase/isomerase family protein [Blastocatellia bacterium]